MRKGNFIKFGNARRCSGRNDTPVPMPVRVRSAKGGRGPEGGSAFVNTKPWRFSRSTSRVVSFTRFVSGPRRVAEDTS